MRLDWRSFAKSSQTCTSLRCTRLSRAQAGSTTNSLLSGIAEDVLAKIHWIVRCAPDCPVSQQRLRQRSTVRSAHNQRATRGQRQWSLSRIRLSGVHQTVSGVPRGSRVQWSASPKKERNRALFMSGGAPDCPVRQRTEGKNCLPNGVPTAPSCPGAIKGTPMRMEQYTKPPLNILRRLDSASTHPDHCV
jgi:hypothetical protein